MGRGEEIMWSKTSLWKKKSRTPAKNIVKILPGPRNTAVGVRKEIDAFLQFITLEMVEDIVKFTNIFIERKRQYTKYSRSRDAQLTTKSEMMALLGLLYLLGLKGQQHTNVREVWAIDGTGMLAVRACMGLNRFLFLLRAIRFDDHATRDERQKTDRLAAVRSLLTSFEANCKKKYSLSEFVTIDEKLIPFRGRCSFIQYMPAKPAKYGLKIYALNDAETFYTSSFEVYCGKQPTGPFEVSNKPYDIVHRLVDHIKGSQRNLTIDNWYTSYDLVESLLDDKLTCVGTLRKNKREIPLSFLPQRQREVGSTLFGYQFNMMLVSHVPKQNKAVLLLTSLHDDDSIDVETHKPDVIIDYNRTKGGVDTADQMEAKYSVARVSRRWTQCLFYTMMNIAGINAQIIFKANKENPCIMRRIFLKNLSMQLMENWFKERAVINTLPRDIRLFLEKYKESEPPAEVLERKRGRCGMCVRAKNMVTTRKCTVCKQFICKEHSLEKVTCMNCNIHQE